MLVVRAGVGSLWVGSLWMCSALIGSMGPMVIGQVVAPPLVSIVCRVQVVPSGVYGVYGTVVQSAINGDGRAEEYSNGALSSI